MQQQPDAAAIALSAVAVHNTEGMGKGTLIAGTVDTIEGLDAGLQPENLLP